MLIFDEATRALDKLIEHAVMEAVHNLGPEITIILIAHRLSTVKDGDTIFPLEKGDLEAQGKFNEPTQANERLRAMAVGHSGCNNKNTLGRYATSMEKIDDERNSSYSSKKK